MNKSKKIAIAVVSTVMAGTMVFSIAGCKPKTNRPNKPTNNNGFDYSQYDQEPTLADDLKPNVDESGKLSYTDGTALNMNVGNNNDTKPQSISYKSFEISGSIKMPDGKYYGPGELKPAWAALKETLKIDFKDEFQNKASDEQISVAISSGTLANYDVISGSLQSIVERSSNFLNLNDYVYYMPNYKAFLKSQSVSQYSLTAAVNGTNAGAMYAAPYYDGNDDIEKYALAKREWVRLILDGDVSGATTTFAAQATAKQRDGTSATVTSYMGTTGSWSIATTKPGTDGVTDSSTVTVTVDYTAALNAAKDGNSELGKALTAAGVTDLSALTSGNIVDLQNAAINATNGGVTGAQLIGILREYIKVAYKDGNDSFYNGKTYGSVTTKLSDVFNSSYAAWDVDLLAAMTRCVVTGINLFDSNTQSAGLSSLWGLAARQGTTQRRVDLLALAGELYGVRGMESRYEYTYIDANGDLKDARSDVDTYEILNKFSAFAKEGLLYTGDVNNAGNPTTTTDTDTGAVSANPQSFMMHDYAQTQTKNGFNNTDTNSYDFAPILTPVSYWDTDSNGTRETHMRFTESWRSVKNTGFAIPVEAVRGNANKLSAVLTFVDHLFSNDGQLLMTYGAPSSSNETPDGWWYNKKSSKTLAEVADEYVDATNRTPKQYKVKDEYKKQVFIYNGEVYEGLDYADRCVPEITDANRDFYLGKEVNGVKQNAGQIGVSAVYDYTGYARKIVGTTLPIGYKDQGFEYQATSACGLDGAANVNVALQNGTISHVELVINSEQTAWYVIAPTALPLPPADQTAIATGAQEYMSKTLFLNTSKTNQRVNVFIDIMFYGFGANVDICGQSSLGKMKENAAEYSTFINDRGLTVRLGIFTENFDGLKEYFKINY